MSESSPAATTAAPSSGPAAQPEYPEHIDAAVLKIAGVVVLGAIMSILDITVVNVAMPTFQTVFSTDGTPLPYADVAWVSTGYLLALATVIPLTGWAADRFGPKRLYLVAVTAFTLGSALCAMASSLGMLVGFRVIQGLGGGMLMPLGMMIMTKAAGPKRMGRLMAILGVPMLLGPILGPILGGVLIDAASWHWIFLINVPIGLLALAYASWALPKDHTQPSETLDWVGLALMSPGLAMFLYGVSSIPGEGTFLSAKVAGFCSAGLVLIAAFVVWTFRPSHPLLDFRLFKNRNFTVAVATMFLFAGAFFGALMLVPTYFQEVRGDSVTRAGLLMAAQGIGAMLTMPVAGALADRLPVGRIVPFGIVLIMLGFVSMTRLSHDTSMVLIEGSLFVMGLGMGLTMMPIMTSALKTLTAHEVSRGSTMLNIIQQIASSLGVATMSVLLTNGFKQSQLFEHAQAFGEATRGVTDPARLGAIMRQFPDVAQIVAPHAGDQKAAQAALKAAMAPELAPAFAHTFVVAMVLVAITLFVSLLLPRKREESHFADDGEAAPLLVH